jgi:hypothetical protein
MTALSGQKEAPMLSPEAKIIIAVLLIILFVGVHLDIHIRW